MRTKFGGNLFTVREMPKERNCVNDAPWGVEARLGESRWALGLQMWTCVSRDPSWRCQFSFAGRDIVVDF